MVGSTYHRVLLINGQYTIAIPAGSIIYYLSITFSDENDVILQDLRPPLRFTAERPRNCTIIRTLVNNDELQEETFAVSITSSPVNELNPVRIIRNITTVTIEDRQFTITAPPLVNVSEGIPAVVCYTIIPIRRLLEREEGFSRINNLTLTLNIQDISTCM